MKKYLLIIIALVISKVSFSQDDDSYVYGDNTPTAISNSKSGSSGFDWSRVTIGGGLGMTFGDYTVIEVAPNVGYYLTDNILVGVGANYTYYNDKIYNFSTSLYGGRVFSEYIFTNAPLLAHVELEVLNVEDFSDGSRVNIVNPYVGGGLKQNFGGYSYFYILVLWNLNETPESYALQPFNPIIRGGIAIGL